MLEQSWGQVVDELCDSHVPLPHVLNVGWAEGLSEGLEVGEEVIGIFVGFLEGDLLTGAFEGCFVGLLVGCLVGAFVGIDFLLILLRDLLQKRPDLRVVLMSATLNADSFAEYFNKVNNTNGECKHLSVPTQPRHPVDVFYLEDIMSMDNDVQVLARTLLQYHDEKLRIELEEAESEVAASLQLEKRSLDEDEGLLLDSDSDSDDSDGESEYVSSTSPASRVKALRRALSLRRNEDNPMQNSVEVAGDREAGGAVVKLISKLALRLGANEIASGR
jgi:hypothetical protein